MPLAAKHLGVPKGEEWSAPAPSSSPPLPHSLSLPFCLLRFICHFFYCFNMLIAFMALLLLLFLVVVVAPASAVVLLPFSLSLSLPLFGISFLSFLKLFWVRLVSLSPSLSLISRAVCGADFANLAKGFCTLSSFIAIIASSRSLSLCFLPSYVMCAVRVRDFSS